MLITIIPIFFVVVFSVWTAALYNCFPVALHLNQCAPPSSIKWFVLDEFDNWMSAPVGSFPEIQYITNSTEQQKCCLFKLFIYIIFTAFKYDLMLLSNQNRKRKSDKMSQRQSTAGERQKQGPKIHIHLQKQRKGIKDRDQHKKFNKCTILFWKFVRSVMNMMTNS